MGTKELAGGLASPLGGAFLVCGMTGEQRKNALSAWAVRRA